MEHFGFSVPLFCEVQHFVVLHHLYSAFDWISGNDHLVYQAVGSLVLSVRLLKASFAVDKTQPFA